MNDISQYALNTKYTRWYQELIEKSKNRNSGADIYYEKHHIIPKCVDKSLADDNENLISLTAREHYIAHWLLTKMFDGPTRAKLLFAFNMMHICSNGQRKYMNSVAYENNRKNYSNAMKNDHWTHREENKEKIKNAALKRERNLSECQRIRRSLRAKEMFAGKKFSDEHRDKISKSNTGVKKTKTEKLLHQYEKQREDAKTGKWISPTQGQTREKFVCPHCGKSVDIANFKRWHGPNCKKASSSC